MITCCPIDCGLPLSIHKAEYEWEWMGDIIWILRTVDPFVEQLYIMVESQLLTNPSTLYSDFVQQCSIDYIRHELADFLEAGIGHDGAYPQRLLALAGLDGLQSHTLPC